MTKAWILVADSSRARLFAVNKALEPLREINSFSHAESRARTQDLISDRQGRRNDNGSNMAHEIEPKRQQAMVFAKQLSQHLKSGRTGGLFQKLYIAAAPGFLGLLRSKLDATTAQLVIKAVNKDLTQLDPIKIRGHLPERL